MMAAPGWKSRAKSAEDLMIEAECGRSPVDEARRVAPAPDTRSPGVYFLAAVNSPFVKIGTVVDARKVDARMERLQSGCPFALQRLFVLSPAGRIEESRLHKRFAAQHYRGEWFRMEGSLKEFLQFAMAFPDEATDKMLRSLSY